MIRKTGWKIKKESVKHLLIACASFFGAILFTTGLILLLAYMSIRDASGKLDFLDAPSLFALHQPAALTQILAVTDEEKAEEAMNEIPLSQIENPNAIPKGQVKKPVSTPAASIHVEGLKHRSVRLPVAYLSQNPELPTGCEITSLTTVLNFYGFSVSKMTMARSFLPKSDTSRNFWKTFVGNPEKSNGFGCYAQPITDAANAYLATQNTAFRAYNKSGTAFEMLLSFVESGTPVVIWGTMSMAKPYTTYTFTIEDGSSIQWIAPEHCMVLIGYDLDRNVAIISDPQKGIVEYRLDTVKSRYLSLHSQCVILSKPEVPEKNIEEKSETQPENSSSSPSTESSVSSTSDSTTASSSTTTVSSSAAATTLSSSTISTTTTSPTVTTTSPVTSSSDKEPPAESTTGIGNG